MGTPKYTPGKVKNLKASTKAYKSKANKGVSQLKGGTGIEKLSKAGKKKWK